MRVDKFVSRVYGAGSCLGSAGELQKKRLNESMKMCSWFGVLSRREKGMGENLQRHVSKWSRLFEVLKEKGSVLHDGVVVKI